MARPIRWFPPSVQFYSVVIKCSGDAMLMRPDPRAVFLLAQALRDACLKNRTIDLLAFCFVSNHAHLILGVRGDGRAVSAFMKSLDEKIAMDLNRHRDGRRGQFFACRPKITAILDDAHLEGRLTYTHAQPVHHDLVERAEDWPGLSSFRAVCEGKTGVEVAWLDEDAWRRAGARPDQIRRHTRRVEVPLSPLPKWAALSERERGAARRAHEQSVRDREGDKAAERRALGQRRALGKPARLTRVDPFSRPAVPSKRSSRVWAHGERSLTAAFRAAYTLLLVAYRAASARFRETGERDFPPSTFAPWAYWLSEVA
jgi:REP element-mobilizing transposase RayT